MNEGSITSKWERPDFRWFSNFEREWRNIDNEGKTDFRLKRVCFNIKHTCLELKIQSDSARFPSGVQPRVSSVHIQTAINHVSLVHGVNFHAEAKKTFTLSTLRWTTKLSSHSYRAHTHTHTVQKQCWMKLDVWPKQTDESLPVQMWVRVHEDRLCLSTPQSLLWSWGIPWEHLHLWTRTKPCQSNNTHWSRFSGLLRGKKVAKRQSCEIKTGSVIVILIQNYHSNLILIASIILLILSWAGLVTPWEKCQCHHWWQVLAFFRHWVLNSWAK